MERNLNYKNVPYFGNSSESLLSKSILVKKVDLVSLTIKLNPNIWVLDEEAPDFSNEFKIRQIKAQYYKVRIFNGNKFFIFNGNKFLILNKIITAIYSKTSFLEIPRYRIIKNKIIMNKITCEKESNNKITARYKLKTC